MGAPAVYGVYRLIERLGNALGPLLAAVLVLTFGYRASFVMTGALVMLCGACFVMATRRTQGPASDAHLNAAADGKPAATRG